MIISNLNELLNFFGNNRRVAATAQSDVARLYAYVYAWKGYLDRADDQVITLDKISAECARVSGVDVAYGFLCADPGASDLRLYIIRRGTVGVIDLADGRRVAEITSPIEEIPY